MLLEPTGNLTNPLSTVDISSLSIQVAIGDPDSSPEALQTTFSKDTSTNKFSGTLNINTSEMIAAFNAATGNTISRFLEIEVEGTASQYHTVLQQAVTLSKDIISHPLVSPSNVTVGTAFANSFSATATDSTTVEWTLQRHNYAHLIGAGIELTAGQYLKVNSAGTGRACTVSVNQTLDDHTDVDLTTVAAATSSILPPMAPTGCRSLLDGLDGRRGHDHQRTKHNDILSWDGTTGYRPQHHLQERRTFTQLSKATAEAPPPTRSPTRSRFKAALVSTPP